MQNIAAKMEELIETLKQRRDELRVKKHLGSLDARGEREALEKNGDQSTVEIG